ncbi:hypothetical protein [Eleftheria terrae]|uniref:hypothetical protein n=1 Tax=Eleftheria terrae TaxID=1597781 RepID=UPI00263BBC58|nr:hypothetical protein [Eleftheria terrae]WKB50834.1 hypothetical protein N7L95_13515 [Eleftheria terrae]
MKSTAPSAARRRWRAALNGCMLAASFVVAGTANGAPTRAVPLGDRGPQIVCPSGGDLYFEIGGHRVRIAAERWAVRLRVGDGFEDLHGETLEACSAEPLRVYELRVFGPAELPLRERRTIALLDTRSNLIRELRTDFLPHESSCRRGPHWTTCSTAAMMREMGPDDWTASLRFDPDFYRAPDGAPFFIVGTHGYPMIGNFGPVAFYRWDAALAVAYRARPCRPRGPDLPPDCQPNHYIEADRELRRLVQGLIEPSPLPARAGDGRTVTP